jgi:hypothetical protein
MGSLERQLNPFNYGGWMFDPRATIDKDIGHLGDLTKFRCRKHTSQAGFVGVTHQKVDGWERGGLGEVIR